MALVALVGMVLGACSSTVSSPVAVPADGRPVEDVTSRALAYAPPMGWNSWNRFGCDIDEQLIRDQAEAMVRSGMREAGYYYVVVDDCWMAPQRDAQGRLQPDPERFPSGMAALGEYVHRLGLGFGLYASAGATTCTGLPGSFGYEEIDARTFAEWGVDYLKYDYCDDGQGTPPPPDPPASERYDRMITALRNTGRPVVVSVVEWGINQPWLWSRQVGGRLWRTTLDIKDNWDRVVEILDQQVGLEAYSGPGGWNDPDMLEVGNGGMTVTEYRSHFSLWALLNAPLMAGNDLVSMDEETRRILLNRELIEVNQDWGGIQGHKVRDDGDVEVWVKPMSDCSTVVVLFNRAEEPRTVTATVEEAKLPRSASYHVRDLWTGEESTTTGELRGEVEPHGVVVYRVTPDCHPWSAPTGRSGNGSPGNR